MVQPISCELAMCSVWVLCDQPLDKEDARTDLFVEQWQGASYMCYGEGSFLFSTCSGSRGPVVLELIPTGNR